MNAINVQKTDFTPEKIQLEFKEVLADPDADYEDLNNRLAQFDRPTLERILEQRGDMDRVEISAITVSAIAASIGGAISVTGLT